MSAIARTRDSTFSPYESLALALRESKNRVITEEEKTISQFEQFMTAMQEQFDQLTAENLALHSSLIQSESRNRELEGLYKAEITTLREEVKALKSARQWAERKVLEIGRRSEDRIQALIVEKVEAVKVAIQAGDARFNDLSIKKDREMIFRCQDEAKTRDIIERSRVAVLDKICQGLKEIRQRAADRSLQLRTINSLEEYVQTVRNMR